MKHAVRAYALGIFTATSLLTIVYFQSGEANESSQPKPITKEKASNYLEKKGYHILSNSEYQSLQETTEEPKKSKKSNQSTSTKEEQNSENNTASSPEKELLTLTINQGMYSKSISRKLNEMGLVEDTKAFNQYLEMNDFSRYIQVGSYELKKDMTYEEIANAITNK
ncbi:hypothetical protein GLW08_09225 [Pontibacillus yanchengensis]|uniref:Endolytic transglycosylase MltG n=2 Tax=Pontibacillus yanchengensis TaxID=462910 RepID=A0A6I4ZTD1_9BACI|nr:endolytic transglycosylase MltG [Pontibacillus yanchengensis]MYL33465.1 hypothetical protein [Pontibacillus yanchengensis]MYL53515.1 hypothetical protein [Pontibacillus yanchengensis]